MSAEGSDAPSEAEGDAPASDAGAKKERATAKTKKGRAAPSAGAEEAAAAHSAFAEGNHETTMTYGHGGLPRYIAFVWVSFLIGYAVYFYVFGLPDLTAWGSP